MRNLFCMKPYLLIILSLFLAVAAHGQNAPEASPNNSEPDPTTRELTYVDAVVLGVVEGLTEYIPVSSTGHLILANRFLGLDVDQPVYAADGVPLTTGEIDPATGAAQPYTLKHAADAYAIIIQGGAILAVLILYWRRVWGAASGTAYSLATLAGKPMGEPEQNRAGLLLTRNLIAAFIPAAVLGLLLEDLIDSHLFGPGPVVIALVAGSFLMFGVEAWRKRRMATKPLAGEPEEGPDLHELTIGRALLIGFLQCVAMWPGTSRSMMTIVGGYLAGLNPRRAAEFSFLLGLITLTAASGWKLVKPYLTGGPTLFETMEAGPVLFGILVATIAAALAVKWLVNWLSRHGLAAFAWYRLALAAVIAGWLWL